MSRIYSLSEQGLSSPEQGSQEWLDGRKGRITGSKPAALFFEFKKSEDWDLILDKWFGDTKEDFDDIALSRMAWGSQHEDTAVQVIVDNIPGSHFFECSQININDVYAASPDGSIIVLKDGCEERISKSSLRKEDVEWHANVEIKCPGGGVGKTPKQMAEMVQKKWRRPASYYMMQIHQEMAAQGVDSTLFVVWTPLLTRMWRIPFNPDFWASCLEVYENFRLKNVSFEVMHSKVQKLKRRCYGVANFPIWKEIHH